MNAATEVTRAFGGTAGSIVERGWSERVQKLSAYIEDPARVPVEDQAEIRRALAGGWDVPVIETGEAIGSMGPLVEADANYGRCGVRLLDLLGGSRVYLVIRRWGPSRSRLLWALLHELGHLVNHFELLLSLSTLYHRVCMDPALEMEIGRVARSVALPLHKQHELEADLFAIDWLLPRWMDDDAALRRREQLPEGLSADGYRLFRLRRSLDDAPGVLPSERDAIEALNRAAAEERARCSGSYPFDGQLWRRATWMLFRRSSLGPEVEAGGQLRSEYFQVAGYPPRHVPELRGRPGPATKLDPELAWLPRVGREEALARIDGAPWNPLLLPSRRSGHPPFHIPVRPVPARSRRDSQLGWVHMSSSKLARPRSVEEWIARAEDQQVGLLLFPRNPAELALDNQGTARA